MIDKATQKVAVEFSKLVREELADVLLVVIAVNRANPPSVCATHDFCDANMLMQQAFINALGVDPVDYLTEEWYVEVWNEAWNIAKAAEFKL
jgi:hypothetical protein